jgi:hypothetical protein
MLSGHILALNADTGRPPPKTDLMKVDHLKVVEEADSLKEPKTDLMKVDHLKVVEEAESLKEPKKMGTRSDTAHQTAMDEDSGRPPPAIVDVRVTEVVIREESSMKMNLVIPIVLNGVQTSAILDTELSTAGSLRHHRKSHTEK